MQRAKKQPKTNESSFSLQWKQGAMFSAFVAMIAVQMFRMDQHRWVPAIWIEAAVFTTIPVLLFLLVKRWRQMSPESMGDRMIMLFGQAMICFSSLLLIVWQFLSRSSGLGDANEVVALLTIQVISWHLAVFASVRGFERASFMLCGALVFFVCCMTKRQDIFAISAFFAVSALWWMAGLYWSRLDSKAIDGETKMLAIHGSTTAISALVIAIGIGIAMLVPISKGQISVAGFMPFSGGDEGYQDEFAASGVGDGDMLTGGANAETVGAVETDQFIEDDKPSMYDVMTDMYDGPVFKKRRNRAVAIEKKAKHIHDVKQSEQSGRTFRTMRDSDKVADLELESRVAKALFFVEGSVPARFINDTFQHFDGWDWSKVSIENIPPLSPKIKLKKSFGKPFYRLSQFKSDYLTSDRLHKVKMMRLESPVLPAPCFLDKWHIPDVDQNGMFNWGDAGLVEFAGELIPPQTVINVKSFVPNYHVMRSKNDLRHKRKVSSIEHTVDEFIGVARKAGNPNWQDSKRPERLAPESPFLQIPANDTRGKVDELASKFTYGIEPGWNQVESIMNHMREDFQLVDWEADESVDDTVGHFLELNGGPSYMFATSCVMILRSAGYRTRLASGFLVRQEDYDRKAKQSIVTSKCFHMWPEVCLDGKFWIPLEPTPGFPIPYSTETTWQWLVAKAYALIGWIWSHPIPSLLLATLTFLAHRFRANVVTSMMLGWWHLVRHIWPQNLLTATRQLIDLRFWAAGDRRPDSKTIKHWYTRVEPQLAGGFFDLWNAKNYSSSPPKIASADLVDRCREQIESLTLGKIQTFVSDKTETEIR